jgi:ASCH domain
MKTLTIRQPWASLVISGIKTVENRSWNTNYRGELIIHAGLGIDRDAPAFVVSIGAELPEDLPAGTILGTVRLVDVVTDSDSPWAEAGKFHWVLADPKPWTEPVPAKGKLKLWDCDIAAPVPAPVLEPEPESVACGRDTEMFTAPAPAISTILTAVPRPNDILVCDCGTDLIAAPAVGCNEPYGHVIVLRLGQLYIVTSAERDGTVGADFTLRRGSYANMTPAGARQLGAAFIQAAESDRLAALTRDLDCAADVLDSVPA